MDFVKSGNVTIKIYPWRHPSGRDYFRFEYTDRNGKVKQVTRATLEKAKDAAKNQAISTNKNQLDISALSATQIQGIKRMLDADPTLSLVDEFITYYKRARPTIAASASIAQFLLAKRQNRGTSTQNIDTLSKHLGKFSAHVNDSALSAVTASQVQEYINSAGSRSPRYRLNIRRSLVQFFRWARKMGHLADEITAAEKTEKPIITRSTPKTYTLDEIQIILANCKPQHLAFFALQAFAGIRGDEMTPTGEKSPLNWSDFDWQFGHITIRPETAKTKIKRIVPINAALDHYLRPIAKDHGRIAATDPRDTVNGVTETKRLGELIGGWRQNALRHSFISNRAALVGLGKAAMEAGNSESESKRSYNDAKTEGEAKAYFSKPKKVKSKTAR